MAAWCELWNIKINDNKTRAIYFTYRNRPPDSLLTLNGQDIPFVNSVKYLSVIFRRFFRIYSQFKSVRLSASIKFTLYKALIRSVMIFACPAKKCAAESHLLKLRRLQNSVLRIIGNIPRSSLVRDMHEAFQIPYIYEYITKSCRQQ
jgi:hypothetical protein